MPSSDLERMEAEAQELLDSLETDKLSTYRPYPKQREFHKAGAKYRERLLMAANQVGKTLSAAMEAAMHATGRYPAWWEGRRFDRHTVGWVAGISAEQTRDNAQRLLMGRDNAWGTGAIPKDCIVGEPVMARSVANAIDYVRVKNVNGYNSIIAFKTYEKGREKWQGDTIDWMWPDEEPPLDVYTEGLTRTNASMGPVFVTFTPLMGESAVVKRFKREQSPDRIVINMTLDDAQHYTPEQRAKIEASYPEHEREARAKGIPVLGSGLVFPVARSVISCDPFPVPAYWPALGGLDFGWDHPTAAVKLRWDKDADVIYVTNAYRRQRETPVIHAAAVKPWGVDLLWAWPHDGLQHDKQSGEQTAQAYRNQGLKMLPDRATFEDGTAGLEAGITLMLERMQTGRFKVFSHLNDWWDEFMGYHRKEGIIVKEGDDLISATRYAFMMRRYAKAEGQPAVDRYAKKKNTGGSPWAA